MTNARNFLRKKGIIQDGISAYSLPKLLSIIVSFQPHFPGKNKQRYLRQQENKKMPLFYYKPLCDNCEYNVRKGNR